MTKTPRSVFPLACFFALASLLALAGFAPGIGTAPHDWACVDRASVRQLAEIVNSRDDAHQCLGITVAGGAITSVRFENHVASGAVAEGAPPVKVTDYPVALIESQHGAVLDGRAGHDAVILKGHFSPMGTSATLMIRYLYNGLTGEYRQCRVSIDRSGDSGWHLWNALHQMVERIVVRTWALPLVGTAGIATLEGACAAGV
ncbi:MAG: hypothetical protein ACREFQ_06970 [Stellaceae bacterium]